MIGGENYNWPGVLEFLHVKHISYFRNNIKINHLMKIHGFSRKKCLMSKLNN